MTLQWFLCSPAEEAHVILNMINWSFFRDTEYGPKLGPNHLNHLEVTRGASDYIPFLV